MHSQPTAIPFDEQQLHVMAKPIGAICNLDCEYCYYLHKEDLYPGTQQWRMSDATLEAYIRQFIDAQPAGTRELTFAWQGGEPTLLGVEFFERVTKLQQQLVPSGCRVVNSLQTNGVLLDDDWLRLFREHDFLIGLSIDGPPELHDRYRVDKKGEPTFEAVSRALDRLLEHKIEFNVLVVVHRHNADHGRRIYRYLRDRGVTFMQFIPLVERRGVGRHGESAPHHDPSSDNLQSLVSSRSVLPEQFGRCLTGIYEEWLQHDVGRVFVQIFDQALSAWLGVEPSLCVFRQQCGRAVAVEHNGDVYSCDHFVEPDYRLGNLHELPIVELAGSERQRAFGEEKETSLPSYCRECEVRFICNGECPKNRFIHTPDGEAGLNYLCAGYRAFFNHIAPTMAQMATAVRAGRPASEGLRRSKPKVSGSANRNDPCPCGSGRKYKKCCLR